MKRKAPFEALNMRPKKQQRLLEGERIEVATSEAVQYHCDYCRKDISKTVRISCATCPEFDLCVECFCVGVELKEHKNNHDYRVIDNMHFPLFSTDWGADEELLLVEGFEKFGYGNWVEISEHVSTKKMEECREHFESYYMNQPNWPEMGDFIVTREDILRINKYKPEEDGSVAKLVSTTTSSKNDDAPKLKIQNPVKAELSGYMPTREEFETEWDNDAEVRIEDLEIEEDDTQEEIDLKLKIFEIYNFRLEVRIKRRKFAVEKKLHDYKYQDRLEKSRSKSALERDLHTRYKRYLQVLDPKDFQSLLKDLAQEDYLKNRIKKLQKWRKFGLSTLKEGEEFSNNKKRNDKRAKPKRRKEKTMFNLKRTKDFELLLPAEQYLCTSAKIFPHQYLLIKETVLREYIKKQENIALEKMQQFVALDKDKVTKLYDYFVQSGWINNEKHQIILPSKIN